MKTKLALAALGLAMVSSLTALAQDSDHVWSKSYPVTGKPTLAFDSSDATVEIRSCSACKQISIRVEVEGKKLSDYRIEESQTGDQVHFRLHPIEHVGFYMNFHKSHTSVAVETPAELTLEAKTSDGGLNVNDLKGELGFTTGDGDVTLDRVAGSLRIKSGDGRVNITNASGSLDARTSDGNLNVDGVFHVLTLHTSDGTLGLNLREGTKLTEASTIQSSDGSVTLRLPASFAADLSVHTSDGHVDCALPLTMDHYHSAGGDGHELHGQLNGGGTPLTIHTSDGSVKIEQL
jgi:Putative adhesin